MTASTDLRRRSRALARPVDGSEVNSGTVTGVRPRLRSDAGASRGEVIPDRVEWLCLQADGPAEPDGPFDRGSVAAQPPASAADHPPEVGQPVERVVRHALP